MDDMDLSKLSSDVAVTSSARPPLDVAVPLPRRHRTILDPVSAALTKVAPNSYEVFLCHRGPDTKATLVDALRSSLSSKHITCFVDYLMEEGVDFPPTLNQAIHNSKVHIVVLSPRFAESSYCLDEVQKIMEMQKNSKAKTRVLPIFFHVEPAHVRHQRTGSAYDLSKLRNGFPKAKIDQWSQALVDLADINGFVLRTDRYFLGKVIEEIVSRVEKLLWDRAPSDDDSKWATQIEQAEQMLCLNNDDNVVSIGVRGNDKSGFAMELYKKLRHDFPAACILQDVKGKAKCEEDLIKLQMILLKDLVGVGNPPTIHSTAEGLAQLLDCLKHVKCLIVLDDIEDDDEQLRSLLILDQHQLSGGSRLVLTSHYPCVLDIRAHVKGTIHLQHEAEVEKRGKQLAICWGSLTDINEGFIHHLFESLSMLGLYVSEVRGVDLLNAACEKQPFLILVILSQSFIDSLTCMEGLNEAYRLCPGVKFVCIYYGLQSERITSLQSEITSSTSHNMLGAVNIGPVLSRGLSKTALQFPVDFENNSRFDMVAFKSLINDIVLNHMQHKYKMYVTKFPVGLRERQEELESQICGSIFDRKKVCTFGILGMGGIGKTTLAKSIYNRIHNKFEGADFLNVGTDAKQSHGLESLQGYIATILNKGQIKDSIRNVEEGKALLTRKLRGTRILLILDDIDHISQLDALFSPLDLGLGSIVVITTRDRSILEAANVNHLYEMKYLDQEKAKKLFYWHAFLKPFPPTDLENDAQKVINACGGLPLSLEVIGAHLYNHNDPKFWKDALVHLKNAGNDIFKQLGVSVNALERDQKEAFLDVCCFLIGKRVQTALRIWEGCDWAAETCVDVLKSKCLITVDPIDSTIGMHDQLRDMGRYIADGRTYRTHIWDAKDASDIPQGAIDQLRGFAMIPKHTCEASDLGRLCGSKILLLNNLKIGGDFSRLHFDQIRWLEWQESPFRNLPPGLYCSRQLRVLDLSGSIQLETLWGSSQSGNSKVPENLQELNLSGCFSLKKLPQFNVYLQSLECLSLSDCYGLSNLHDSIASLKKLKFLDLSRCKSLRYFPDTIEGLHSLEKLRLQDCKSLRRLPEGIGKCRNLIEIDLGGSGVTNLPKSFGELRNLKELHLSKSSLRSLPDTIEGLHSLKKLCLQGCESLSHLPEGIGKCRNLIEIDLGGSGVTTLPESFGKLRNLKELHLGFSRLGSLPDTIGGLHSLEKLRLCGCKYLERLPEGIGRCRNLKELKLGSSSVQSLPDTIEGLHSLEKLGVRLGKSRCLPEGIGRCRNLTEIDLGGSGVTNLPESIGELRNLKELHLSKSSLGSLPDTIEGLHSLEKLGLGYCKSLERLPEGIGRCRNLTEIDLGGSGVTNLPESLGELRNLKELHLSGSSLRSLPDAIEGLHSLEKLRLQDCKSLGCLPEGIGKCRNLIEIDLCGSGVTNLPESFGELRNLKKLYLRGSCEKLVAFPNSLGAMNMLKECDLSRCRSLQELPENFSKLNNLCWLDLSYCCNLERVSGLDGLNRLECLRLRGCDKLRYLNGFEHLESLQELDISLCRALDSSSVVPDILGLAVRRLYIGESSVVPSMDILQMPNLESLSWCGWELRGGFREIQLRAGAGLLDSDVELSRLSNFAAVLVSVLIPRGYVGRVSYVNVIRDVIEIELCWVGSQAKEQVMLLILRPGCEPLQCAPVLQVCSNFTGAPRRESKYTLQASYKVEEFIASAIFNDISLHETRS